MVPWRLIGFLAILVIVAIFASLNIEHKTDISFGIYVFHDVPVFLGLFIAFVLGTLAAIPFFFGRKRKKPPQEIPEEIGKQEDIPEREPTD